MKTLKQVQTFAQMLKDKEEDLGNMTMMNGISDMVEMNWQMENKAWWIEEQISSDAYDSLKDAVDLMGTRSPKLSVTPYGPGDENRKQAEAIEEVLMWELTKVLNRRGSAHKEATRYAYQYGRVAAQIIYLPWQIESLKSMKKDTKRHEIALEMGDFMLKVYDTRAVYPHYTDYGLEGVLVVTVLPAHEVVDFWGENNTTKLRKHIQEEELQWVTQFDYWDLEQRTVWVVPHDKHYNARPDEEGYEVHSMELDMPFLPWVVSDLGEELRPMLYSAWKSGQWELMNVYLSASSSEVRAYIAAPRMKISGPNPSSVRVDYGVPHRPIEEPPGHEVTPFPPPGSDPALTEKIIQLQGMVSKSTISHSVATADFGEGAAYASIRELIDLASRRLNDGKSILESFYRDVFIKMLRWINFEESSITAYVDKEYYGADQIKLMSPAKFGEMEEMMEGVYTFNPSNLDFRVELTADIPEDQVARMNAANLFVGFGGSKAKAMEIVGIANPAKEIERARKEQMDDVTHQGKMALVTAGFQAQAQGLQMNAQQQQMEQAQQKAAMMKERQQVRQQGVGNENLRGPRQAGGMGGMPTDLANPGTSSPPIQGARNGQGIG